MTLNPLPSMQDWYERNIRLPELAERQRKFEARVAREKERQKTASVRRPMTSDEVTACNFVGACTFAVGSFDKRFCRELHGIAQTDKPVITDRQSDLLWRMVVRYRRQIANKEFVGIAMKHVEALEIE